MGIKDLNRNWLFSFFFVISIFEFLFFVNLCFDLPKSFLILFISLFTSKSIWQITNTKKKSLKIPPYKQSSNN